MTTTYTMENIIGSLDMLIKGSALTGAFTEQAAATLLQGLVLRHMVEWNLDEQSNVGEFFAAIDLDTFTTLTEMFIRVATMGSQRDTQRAIAVISNEFDRRRG